MRPGRAGPDAAELGAGPRDLEERLLPPRGVVGRQAPARAPGRKKDRQNPRQPGAAGLEPRALDEAAELDLAADTVRFVLHRGADGLTVDVEPDHDPGLPVIAAMQASDPSAEVAPAMQSSA